MKTFVINLDKYQDNFNYQKPYLENVGLEVYRFKGINAIQNEHLEYKEMINPQALNYCPNSILGCSLSHILLSLHITNLDSEITLIMEDDAFPKFDKELFQNKLKNTINDIQILDKDWDIIQLHSDAPFPTYNTYCIHPLCGSTAAYLISKKGAIKMSKEKSTWHIDIHTSANPKFKKYRSKENLFWTKEETSLNRNLNSSLLTNLISEFLTIIIPLRGEKTWNDFLNFKMIKLKNKDIYAFEIINNVLFFIFLKYISNIFRKRLTLTFKFL